MDNKNRFTGISLSASKEAALYFDYVIPLCLSKESVLDKAVEEPILRTVDFLNGEVELASAHMKSLLPPILLKNDTFLSAWRIAEFADYGIVKFLSKSMTDDLLQEICLRIGRKIKSKRGLRNAQFRSALKIISLIGMEHISIVDRADLSEETDRGDDWRIVLHGLKLIDTSRASWEMIMEFRKDREALSKFRRLRLFANDQYASRDRAFIEDDLLNRIDEYNREVRQWGFETLQAGLGMFLSSSALAGVGGSFISALMGKDALAAASLTTGVSVGLGKLAVEIARRRLNLQTSLEGNPVSYLVHAKKKLETSSESWPDCGRIRGR